MKELSTPDLQSIYGGKRILITGGGGYLATAVFEALGGVDCTLVRLSRSETATMGAGNRARVIGLRGDVRLRTTWEEALPGADYVFHFAAQTSVYVANQDPEADWDVNVRPMVHLLEICREQGLRPAVLFAGTATESGVPEKLPVDETHPDLPITVYDVHKLMAENYLEYYARQGFIRGATLRLANVYGPGPDSGSPERGVLNQMIRKALSGESLSIYGDGKCIRDFVYVQDIVRAFLMAGSRIEQVSGRHFVVGTGKGHTLADAFALVAEGVERKTGVRVEVGPVAAPANLSPIESRNFVADSRRFFEAIGWQATCLLADGIDRTIEAFGRKSELHRV